jgi:hypothetical protein
MFLSGNLMRLKTGGASSSLRKRAARCRDLPLLGVKPAAGRFFLCAYGQLLGRLMEKNSHFTLVALYYFSVVHLVTIELHYMVNFCD